MPPLVTTAVGLTTLIGGIWGGVMVLDARYASKTEVAQAFSGVESKLGAIHEGQLITRRELYRREQWEIESLGSKMTARDHQRLRDLEDAIKEVDSEIQSLRDGRVKARDGR